MTEAPSFYYNEAGIRSLLPGAGHRSLVGGLWEEMGNLQQDFLVSEGMLPDHRLLDIGCGSLRLGRLASAYLKPGNYWGTDISVDLIDAGYRGEIVPAGLDQRLLRTNLVTDAEFSFVGVPASFDFVMAQSVFTHLPLNHLRLCFSRLADHLLDPCTAFFTFFMPPKGANYWEPVRQHEDVVSWSYKDPFHYEWDDIRHAFRGLPWELSLIGNWSHPRNQQIAKAVFHPPKVMDRK